MKLKKEPAILVASLLWNKGCRDILFRPEECRRTNSGILVYPVSLQKNNKKGQKRR